MPTEAIDCDTILKMIEGKTSSLLSYSAMFGAMLGKKTADTGHPAVKSIGDYARACGTAFQLKDDILGLVADEAELGKPVGSDLRDGKKSYPIYLALSRFGEKERAEFLQIYGNGKASPQRQKRAVDMILETGAVRDTESLAVRLVTEAGGLLKDMPDSRYKSYLLAWGAYLVDRSR
jgi:geranylgeranyl pyrophosphate synthase